LIVKRAIAVFSQFGRAARVSGEGRGEVKRWFVDGRP
jgi:hypothetical protein